MKTEKGLVDSTGKKMVQFGIDHYKWVVMEGTVN